MKNKLYLVPVEVYKGVSKDILAHYSGAYIYFFAGGYDPQDAKIKTLAGIDERGFVFKRYLAEPREVPLELWGDAAKKLWPNDYKSLPSKEKVRDMVEKGKVFFGPCMIDKYNHIDDKSVICKNKKERFFSILSNK